MPYGGPVQPGPYPPAPERPAKKRPSAWWFGVGAILLLIAATAAGIAVGMVIHFFTSADTSFSMQGVHQVDLPAHTERMVFGSSNLDTADCVAVDRAGGRVHFRPLGGSSGGSTRSASDFARFDTGSGHLLFRCSGSDLETVWVTAVPDTGRVVLLIVLGAVVPLLVGGLGFVVLLVTTILWFTRRPRSTYVAHSVYPGPPPGPPAG